MSEQLQSMVLARSGAIADRLDDIVGKIDTLEHKFDVEMAKIPVDIKQRGEELHKMLVRHRAACVNDDDRTINIPYPIPHKVSNTPNGKTAWLFTLEPSFLFVIVGSGIQMEDVGWRNHTPSRVPRSWPQEEISVFSRTEIDLVSLVSRLSAGDAGGTDKPSFFVVKSCILVEGPRGDFLLRTMLYLIRGLGCRACVLESEHLLLSTRLSHLTLANVVELPCFP